MDSDKQRLKNLVLDAERLMATARIEARELVSSAELQARELVDAARQLHAAAESESQTIRSEAMEERAAAERQAQSLLNEAHEKHVAAIEQARSMNASDTHEPPGDETEMRQTDERALDEASRRVDHMLRVARSEAKASAQEMMEQARRRAAQIDEDARRREEVSAKQHRALLLSMRDEQLAIRTRIAELRSELRAAGAAADSNEVAGRVTPDADPVETTPTITEERARSESTPPPMRSESPPMRPLIAQPPNPRDQRTAHSASDEADDDYAKAVKRFRRRA